MRISDWSSDVCSSDLGARVFQRGFEILHRHRVAVHRALERGEAGTADQILEVDAGEAVGARGKRGEIDISRKRSAERRVGKECVRTCWPRWSTCLLNKHTPTSTQTVHNYINHP